MIVSHSYRFVYFPPMKTATSTLWDVLRKHFNAKVFWGRHVCLLPKSYEHYFTFASVRNPYSRAISAYNYVNREQPDNPLPILDLLDVNIFPSMHTSIFRQPIGSGFMPIRIDALVHAETLSDDFHKLPFVTKKIDLPRLNVSPKIVSVVPLQVYDFVKQYHREDFEYFGYDMRYPQFGLKIY